MDYIQDRFQNTVYLEEIMTKEEMQEMINKKYPNLSYEEKILYVDAYYDGYKAGIDDMANKMEEKNEHSRNDTKVR